MRKESVMAVIALLALAGCAENELQEQASVDAVAIRIGQKVEGIVTSRAAINDGSTVSAKVLMTDATTGGNAADWSGFSAVTSNTLTPGTGGTMGLTARANVSIATFIAGSTAQPMTLNPTLYYSNDESGSAPTHTWLAAVAPDGTLNGTTVTFGAKDGTVDAMYAAAADAGIKTSPTNPFNLTFVHKTTQIKFAIKITQASGTGEWDGKVVGVNKIELNDAQVPDKMDAINGNVSWTGAAALSIPNISSAALTSTATPVGDPVMVKDKSQTTVNVTLSVGGAPLSFSNIPVTSGSGNLVTEIGKSHLVTLNVNEPAAAGDGSVIINASATVTPWVSGNEGTADLN